jgi:hypothetical protein
MNTMPSLARQLMGYLSYLNPENIPLKPFVAIKGFRKEIEELAGYSMIKMSDNGETISLHRLVSLVERQNHRQAETIFLLKSLVEHWEQFWREQNKSYGTGVLDAFFSLFVKKPSLDENNQVNKLSYDLFYPHMLCITKHIEELTERGSDHNELICSVERLKLLVEEVMDTTNGIFLSNYTKTEKGPVIQKRKREDLIRVLSQGLNSCFPEDCKFLLEGHIQV